MASRARSTTQSWTVFSRLSPFQFHSFSPFFLSFFLSFSIYLSIHLSTFLPFPPFIPLQSRLQRRRISQHCRLLRHPSSPEDWFSSIADAPSFPQFVSECFLRGSIIARAVRVLSSLSPLSLSFSSNFDSASQVVSRLFPKFQR